MKEPVMAKVARRFNKIKLPPETFDDVPPHAYFGFFNDRWTLVTRECADGGTDVFFVPLKVMKRWSYFGAFLKRGKR